MEALYLSKPELPMHTDCDKLLIPSPIQSVVCLEISQYRVQSIIHGHCHTHTQSSLFEGDESQRVCGSDAGPAVLHWLVGHGKLAQVVGHHLRLRGDITMVSI